MYTISIRNMTQVNSTEILIYSDKSVNPAHKVEISNLKMEEGSAGSLTMKISVGNAGYDSLEELSTQVIVYKDTVTYSNKVYWIGRLLNVKIDFDNTKEVTFEGIFNYLMDTIQLPSKSECNLSNWVTFLLGRHNDICTASGEHYKKVYKGTFDGNIDTVAHEFYTDYETSQEMINNAIQYDEAHVFFRYVWDSTNNCYNLYLDFSKNYITTANPPVISFGQNLMDYSRSYEPEELATVIIPRGERYSDEEWKTQVVNGNPPKEDVNTPSELDHYRTVWSCATTSDHTLHDYRVYASSANINRFGYISKIIDFDGVRSPDTLLQMAQNYLANQKWVKLNIDISAVDMKLLAPDINISTISVGLMIHCISQPHGLNYYYPCTAIEEDILDVSGTRYTLGTGDVQYLTDAARDTDNKLKEIVRKNIDRENILTDNILHKPTNSFENIKASIDAVEAESRQGIATVTTDAKADVLNMLNIYDTELNPYNKGYVHFKREIIPYGGAKITLADLKARVNKYFPDSTTASGKTVGDFFTRLESLYDSEDYIIIVLLGQNDYETAIATIYKPMGTLNGVKVPYLGTQTYWNYTQGTQYFATANSQYNFGYNGCLITKSNSSIYKLQLHNNVSSYYQYWFSSYTVECRQATPAFSSMTYVLPNKPTIDSTNYTFYTNKDIYNSNMSSVYKNKNLEKSSEEKTYDEHITEIVVSDKLDYMANDANVWRWNYTGLYSLTGGYYANHSSDYITNPEQTGYQTANNKLRLALTANGDIVADRITAGILNADVIKTGVIRSRPLGNAEPDGNMMIDIPNGNIIAKKGTLIFNDSRNSGQTIDSKPIKVPEDGYIYISNVDTEEDGAPIYLNVGGSSKNDWRIVSGDSFGVDKAGRVWMREGIIGATGGIFSVVARNTSYVSMISSEGYYLWSVKFGTDAARPLFDSENNQEQCWFRFRLAHYDSNNQYVFVTKLFSFQFPVGKDDVVYTNQAFYPALPVQEEAPYYNGELFPVWYRLNDTATEDYYEQDGHRYVITDTTVSGTSSDNPQYTSYTDTRSGGGGTRAGDVTVGSGYLTNGTFGQNKSFYLGGIKRSGTVANNTRDDWRFSVGSKFGVTENGNIYCTDMYARGAYLDRCTVTGNITATSVTHLNLNSHNIWDGESKFTNYRWRINIDPTSYGGGMFASNTDFYVFTEDDPQVVPNKSATFSFKVYLEQVPIDQPSAQPSDKYIETFNFTYNRSGTAGIAQRIQLDTRNWSTPDRGYVAATDGSGNPLIKIGLIEMETAESSSFVYIGFAQEKDCPTATGQGTEFYTYIEGTFTTANVSGVSRDAVACSCDFIGPSKWLGGPRNFWAKAYISEVNNTVSGSGSSKLYKENIEPLNGRYSDLFDKLKPVRYNFRKDFYDDDGKYHTGFIMEDLGESMDQLDIPEKDFAAYNPDHENGGGNIRYDELIALAVDEIQKLKKRVNNLERQLYEKDLFDDTDD